jgi:hypothetical protein
MEVHSRAVGAMSIEVVTSSRPGLSSDEQHEQLARTREAVLQELRNAGWHVTEHSPAEGGEIPRQGLSCDVTVTKFPEGQIFYLSASTLTLLPEYEEWETSAVTYRLYLNGELVRSYEYQVVDRIWMWLPLALLVWLNPLTPDEFAAIAETTRQFLYDAEPQLASGSGAS